MIIKKEFDIACELTTVRVENDPEFTVEDIKRFLNKLLNGTGWTWTEAYTIQVEAYNIQVKETNRENNDSNS